MRVLSLFIILITLFLGACQGEDPSVSKSGAKKKKSHFVEVARVNISDKAMRFSATGILSTQRDVKIINQEEGVLISLPYFEGDRVQKGDVLARLDDTILRTEYQRAQSALVKAQQDLQRVETLFKAQLAAEESLNGAQVALDAAMAEEKLLKTRLAYTTMIAPFNAIVTARLLEPGDVAQRFTHLLTLSDPKSMVVEVQLSDLLVRHIAEQTKVSVSIDAMPGEKIQGMVSRIHPRLDVQTHQVQVEVQLIQTPAKLRAGQFCRVEFVMEKTPRVMLPFQALRRDESSEFVFVVNEQNKIQRRDVKTGVRMGEFVEILNGVQANQQVVTKGFLDLKPGKSVQIVNPEAKASASAKSG